ncbi:hypothetical protein MXB_3300 [Myxobolus squamalis]|nr:hypothetical protein MXB_3300 [Myxobolus squamalis]
MESLYTLLPAVVGVFSDNNNLHNHLGYLKNIPQIGQYLKYLLKHTVDRNIVLHTQSGTL